MSSLRPKAKKSVVVVSDRNRTFLAYTDPVVGPIYEVSVNNGIGPRGKRGVTGRVGLLGPVGPQGFAGIDGAPGGGATGATGVEGPEGRVGRTGSAGSVGAQGPQGDEGMEGASGSTGVRGPQGAAGAQGSSGTQGTQGFSGLGGSIGHSGSVGPPGTAGNQGHVGSNGSVGVTGAAGSQGSGGDVGDVGYQGNHAANGAIGAQGAQGAAGHNGSQGVVGSAGNVGVQGSAGSQGSQGVQGVQGLQGSGTNVGAQGALGAQGPQGPVGVASTARGATGPVGNAGTNSVSAGAAGAQGPQGTAAAPRVGATGAQGMSGSTSTVLGLTVSCNSFNINTTSNFQNAIITWSALDNPLGTIVHNSWKVSMPSATLTCPNTGIYNFTLWSQFAGTLAYTLLVFVSVNGTTVARSTANNVFRSNSNFNQPILFSGCLILTKNDVVRFGVVLPTTYNSNIFGISASNELYLSLMRNASSLVLWLDANDTSTLTLSGTDVTEWRDKSVSGKILQPGVSGATATASPTYDSTSKFIFFNNASTSLSSSTQGLQMTSNLTLSIPAWTCYVVCSLTNDDTGLRAILRWSETNRGFYVHVTKSGTRRIEAAFVLSGERSYNLTYNDVITLNSKIVLSCSVAHYRGAYMFINGVQQASDTLTFTPANFTDIAFNAVGIGGGYDGRSFRGNLHEIRMYNNFHETSERRSIESELVSKWSISGYT